MNTDKHKRIKKCAYCQKPLVETPLGFTHAEEFCDLKCHNLWKSSQDKTDEIINRYKEAWKTLANETKGT